VSEPGADHTLDDLARRAARGDERAFTVLVESLAPAWYRLALYSLGDQERAVTAVHEVAVKLHFALPRWRSDSSVRTWAHRIAINVCQDIRRSARQAQRLVPLDALVNDATPADDGLMSGDPLARDALHNAVANLPPELAAVVSLRYGAGLRFAEIAVALGIPQGTVSTRLRRALEILERTLKPIFAKELT
jgi:RNA polymerase sigma factor (sigma-70 family)